MLLSRLWMRFAALKIPHSTRPATTFCDVKGHDCLHITIFGEIISARNHATSRHQCPHTFLCAHTHNKHNSLISDISISNMKKEIKTKNTPREEKNVAVTCPWTRSSVTWHRAHMRAYNYRASGKKKAQRALHTQERQARIIAILCLDTEK